MGGHQRRAGHLTAARDNGNRTMCPLVAVRAAGRDDFGNVRFLQQISCVFFELHQERARHADGIDFDMTGAGPARVEDEAPFEGAEGNGHIGKERSVVVIVAVAHGTGIGIDACRHVDGDDRHGTGSGGGIDFGNNRGNGLAQAAVEARAQHGIDDHGRGEEALAQELPVLIRLRCRQEQARFPVGQLLQRLQMLTRFVAVFVFFTEDIDIGPGTGSQDMAGNDETVAAVVAFAAENHDILAVPAVQPSPGPFRHGMAGIFHQNRRRNSINAVHRRLIHLPHLSSSIHLLHSILLYSLLYKTW